MGEIKLAVFATDAPPALALSGSGTADSDGDPDAASLCLAWKGASSETLFYSTLPWTSQSHVPGSKLAGRPAAGTSNGDFGRVWVWKDASGSGMSWASDGITGIEGVPNHAHTTSSPVFLPVGDAIDPDSGGIDDNVFLLFWQGDAKAGDSGTAKELWFMPYSEGYGWGTPARVAGASPVTSPAACLGPSTFNTFAVTIAWTDDNGQIWLTQGNASGDADTPWSAPFAGPNASTVAGPAVSYFHGNLIVAWTLPGLGWIMYSTLSYGSDGAVIWSDPARLVGGLTGDSPALAEFSGKLYVAWRGLTDNSIYYETIGSPSHLPAQASTVPQGWPVLITNAVTGNSFTGTVLIGQQLDPVNVIIDTGSSSFAVLTAKYNAGSDIFLKPTTLLQYDSYGPDGETGFWFGPVVQTQVMLTVPGGTLPGPVLGLNISVGIADDSTATHPVFARADGILGLAYPSLNRAFDVSSYLVGEHKPPLTYPWPIPASQVPQTQSAFDTFIKGTKAPEVKVTPFMTQLVQEGLLSNKFALWVFRAMANQRTNNPAADPSNIGLLILGGGEAFYQGQVGPFQAAQIVSDSYYGLNLIAVQVGSNPRIHALPGASLEKGDFANALLDSGTAPIQLQADLYKTVMKQMELAVPNFSSLTEFVSFFDTYQAPNSVLGAADWPVLKFILAGTDSNQITLSCFPTQYWQTDGNAPGRAQFMLQELSDPTQPTVLGLTLMTGYYTIFDRSEGLGIINFAQKPLM
jgi:hypothetical protein